MSDISLSKAVRSNLLSLQNTATMMSKTQERLATGNKVNSALDNPTNYFTASALNSRAGDINQLLDGMNNGIQTLQAADNGLKAITKTLESMQSTLRQARQDKSFQTQSFDLASLNANTALTGTEQLTFAGGSVGSAFAIDLTESDPDATTPAQNANLAATTAISAVTTVPGTPTAPAALSTSSFSEITISEASSFQVNGTTVNLAAGGGTGTANAYTAEDIATAITTALSTVTGNTITADGSSGELVLTNTATGTSAHTTLSNFTGDLSAGHSSLHFGAASSTGGAGTATTSGGINASAGDITFQINNQTVTLGQSGGTGGRWSAEQVRDAINTQVGTSANVIASLNATTGALEIRSTGTASGTDTVTLSNFSGATAADFGFTASSATGTAEVPDPNAVVAKSVDKLVTEINRKMNGSDENPLYGKIRASNDNGKLRIENLSTTELEIDGISSTGVVDGTSTDAASIDGNSVRSDLAAQFRDLRDQLDKLADDASFNGINLLRGDNLQITFNETATSELNIRSKNEQGISSTVLGLATNLQASQLDSDADIDTLIADVKSAINDVRSQSSAFGSSLSVVQNRQDFSKNMINTLQTGAANLTLADMNEEAANLLALQTRQSLSSSALSMASQADQSVLQLLR